MSGDARTDPVLRAAFEDECFAYVQRSMADGASMREDMELNGRHLRSLTLERTSDDAEIVAEMTLDDGTPLTERYSIWTYDTPPNPNDPHEARQAAFMIALGLTKL
jgi:hypothetical protein